MCSGHPLLAWHRNKHIHIHTDTPATAVACVATGAPEPVYNCSVRNYTVNLLLVFCKSGDGGGLRQSFSLEIYNDKKELYANFSTSDLLSSGGASSVPGRSSSLPTSPSSSSSATTAGAVMAAGASSSVSSSYTDADGPNFIIPSLPADSKFTLHIYARNSRGRSPPTLVSAPSFTQSEKQTGKEFAVRDHGTQTRGKRQRLAVSGS